MLAPPELKKIHPLGKAPIIGITPENATEPIILAESGTIIEYLCEHFGKWLIPKRWVEGKEDRVGGETEEWMRYRYFMHYAEGSLMPNLLVGLIVDSKVTPGCPLVKRIICSRDISRH
jgi:glutathione S-transferase